MDVISHEELRQMSYMDLKRHARKLGIKKNIKKTEKLIAAICSKNKGTLESFTTADESRDITFNQNNSWSDDSEIEIRTPMPALKRAGTFCVETPVTPMEKQPKLTDAKMSSAKSYKMRRITSKIVPVSNDPVKNFITSDTKAAKISKDQTNAVSVRQSVNTPAKTPRKSILRRDNRRYSGKKGSLSTTNSRESKSNGSKVNFITPDLELLRRSTAKSDTPLRSVKDRPKTPVPVRSSLKRKRTLSSSTEISPNVVRINGEFTPKLLNRTRPGTSISFASGTKSGKHLTTPMSLRKKLTPSVSVKKLKTSVPDMSKVQTPNFKEIHQRAFEKMETLDEYHERKQNRTNTLIRSQKKSRNDNLSTQLQYSSSKGSAQKKNKSTEKLTKQKSVSSAAKPSRIPLPFRGIPFIPVVKSIRKINTNFATQAECTSFLHSTSKKVPVEKEHSRKKCNRTLFPSGSGSTVFQFSKAEMKENSLLPQSEKKKKFDLKVSLAKKLPYKPHRGALRPLSNSNYVAPSFVDPIKEKRAQSREILKGVRKNRRFELQMSRRGIV